MNNYNPNFSPAPEALKKSKLPLILGLLVGGLLCMIVSCIVVAGVLNLMGSRVSNVFEEIEAGLEATATANNPVGLPTRVPQPQATRVVESDGIISDDGSFLISRPYTMKAQSDLHGEALLQIADLVQEQYLLVIPDDIAVLRDADISFSEYQDLVLGQMLEALEDASVDEADTVVVDGLSGARYQLTGTISGIDLTYYITMLEGSDYYYQITTWTLQELASENGPILIDASDSFELIK